MIQVGFAPQSDYLLVVSHQGRGVFDCISGQKLARDSNDGFDESELTAKGIGILAGQKIQAAGLFGGSLLTATADDWRLFEQPEESARIFLKHESWSDEEAEFIGDGEVCDMRASGFSPTGNSFVIATSCDVALYARECRTNQSDGSSLSVLLIKFVCFCRSVISIVRRLSVVRNQALILQRKKFMLKKSLSFVLIILLLNVAGISSAYAGSKEEKEAQLAERVKENINRLGTGKDARIEVKLRDKTKLKGYVSQISENSFTVVDEKTGNVTEVPYPNAKQVKGNNLSTGVKIAIGVGVVFVALLVIGLIAFHP